MGHSPLLTDLFLSLRYVQFWIFFASFQVVSSAGTSENRNFPHMSLDFLQPNKIRDAQKHLKDDPEYDPRTLFIPDSFLSKQTPVRS